MGFITVFTLLRLGCPDGVLACSVFLFLVKLSISLELNGHFLSIVTFFYRIGFLNVSCTSSSTGMTDFAQVIS